MDTVKSKDGTLIAYDKIGQGPAVILVDGALCYRGSSPNGALAEQLAPNFTVYTYDRRGRGDSGDTKPYAVEREVEDLQALIEAAGGSALVYGISSGAALALDAAAKLKSIKKLAVYEVPLVVDADGPVRPGDYQAQMQKLVDENRRGDAVKKFMRTVGVPGFVVMLMPIMPGWANMTGVAHTLPYDFAVLGDTGSGKPLSPDRWSSIKVPVLSMDGGNSPAYMRHGMKAVANVVSGAQYRTLDGQTHMLKAEAVTPVLVEFFNQ